MLETQNLHTEHVKCKYFKRINEILLIWKWCIILFRFENYTGRLRLKCDGICSETTFSLSAKRTSPFKSAGATVQATAGSRALRISGSNAGYPMLQGSVKSTGYPLHSPVSPSLPPPVRHSVPSHFNWTLLHDLLPPFPFLYTPLTLSASTTSYTHMRTIHCPHHFLYKWVCTCFWYYSWTH